MRYSLIFGFLLLSSTLLIFFLKNEYFERSIVEENIEFFIHKNMHFDELVSQLDSISSDLNPLAKVFFNKFLEKKRLQYWYAPGRYLIQKKSSLNDIVNKLRSRSQDPTKLTFNSMDDISSVFGIMESVLDLDSLAMINFFDSIQYPLDSLYLLLIPNTYELYWDITPKEFFKRMHLEYDNFWTIDKVNLAKKNNLSKHEVFVLASIVSKVNLLNIQQNNQV